MTFGLRLEVGGKLLPKQIKQQCQDDTNNDGGGDRKVKSELLFFDDDITRKFSDPRDLFTNQD